MSIIALDYPNRLQVRCGANIRWIVILIVGLALVASFILVAVSVSAKVDSSSGVVAIPVPVAPVTNATSKHVLPSATATPPSNPVVITIPVPEPPPLLEQPHLRP